jgi:hypothetical protein
MDKIIKIINVNNQYIKYKFPLIKSEIYLIKWLPNSKTDFHGHDGKKCNFLLIGGKYMSELRHADKKSIQVYHRIEPFKLYSIDDTIGYHKMINTEDKTKWSLHRYY